MKPLTKVPKTFGLLFAAAFCAAAVGTAADTAHAGWWRLTAATCPTFSDGTRKCPLPDGTGGQPERQLLNANVEVFDANPNAGLWARWCLRWWHGPGFSCGPIDGTSNAFTGPKTLKPSVVWTFADVLHGWVAYDNAHFAHVQVFDSYGGVNPPGSLKFKGVFYYW
jgi:hypothetical protein